MRPRMALAALLLLLLPAAAPEQADHQAVTAAAGDAYAGTGCLFEGARYRPGQAVAVRDEPCLRCRCRRGAPVCRLRVCAPMPDPPPPGCVLLHRAGACCPQLHCPELAAVHDNALEARHGQRYRSDAPSKGCYLNGSLFAEGSALSSSTLCDYCYCVRGEQRCVRPQCVLPAPGCAPEYRDHTCCPTSYNCGAGANGANGTATGHAPPRRRPAGCTVDGKRFQEGAQVKTVARGRCESCFCMRGRVRCAPLKCDLPLEGCQPVTAPGKCCPVSYDCSKSRLSSTKTGSTASNNNLKGLPGRPSKGENTVRSISYDARSNREISSKDSKVKIETQRTDQSDLQTTQLPLSEETTLLTGTADNIAITLNTKLDLGSTLDLLRVKNNTVIPDKNKILPVLEAMINKTRQKDQDYDYDYNEPSLPPSLPNLRIIPFVAEDAVIPEDKASAGQGQDSTGLSKSKESQDKMDSFYFFSPPTETEGGFVPRDPTVDGPFYQAKQDPNKPEAAQKVAPPRDRPSEVTIRTVIPDAVTPDPLLGNGGSKPCASGGRRYRHGELLAGMGACRMCFCFDGEVQCQEPSCGAVPPGCTRGPAPTGDPDRCCGAIICGDANRDRPLLFAGLAEGDGQRVHVVAEHAVVAEPVPDLVPARRPVPSSTSTTTTTTSTTTTTTTVTPSTTTKSHRHRPTTASTTTTTRTVTKPIVKTKTTTTKPTWTTKRPSSTTLKTSKTTAAPTTTAPVPNVTKPTPTSAPNPSPPTTATTKATTTAAAAVEKTTTAAGSTTASGSTTTSTTTAPAAAPSTTSTTTSPRPTSPPTTTTSTRRSPPLPVRKERPTTTPTSLFDALWGSEDESENEAQDKVDDDVQYHDFVSTNQHEPVHEQSPPQEDDSFSFDKFLELFIQPDPTVAPATPAAPPPSTSTTTTTTTTTTVAPRTTTRPSSTMATSSQEPKPAATTTAAPPSTTARLASAPAKKTASASAAPPKPKPSAPTKGTTTSKPVSTTGRPSTSATSKPSSTTQRSTNSTSRPPPPTTTTRKPAATTKQPTKPSTTTTSKPTTTSTMRTTTLRGSTPAPTTKASTTPKTTAAPKTTTTTSTTPAPRTTSTSTTTTSTRRPTTTTTTAMPLATLRPSLLFGSVKHRPSMEASSGSSSSYPAQLHHMSTRRPPPASTAAPTPTPRPWPGLAGLLKLAGCNIYGRMYRVGKIIQELSGPCLECRCTEVGVQCQQLDC